MLFAGLDIGTSGCKVVVYDLDGKEKASANYNYEEEGTDGYRELNPATVLLGVQQCIKGIPRRFAEQIKALSVGTLGESTVCIDQEGNYLGKSMVTGDKRGIAEVHKILQHFDEEEIMELTGVPVSEMYTLPKFLWMSKSTDNLKQAKYIFLYEDYIGYYLTGMRKVSYSSASRTMAFDIKNKVWAEKLLEMAGISLEQMSQPVDSGTVVGMILPEVAAELGLSEDVCVAAGGHDQECAALGAGVTTPGIGEDGHGTCEVMNIMLDGPLGTEYMLEHDLACVPGMIPNTYMTNVEITTCGILMNWSRDHIFEGIRKDCEKQSENFFTHMDRRAAEIETEVLVLPQFGSSGNPKVSYDAKGLIWGLSVHTRPEEIYLAIKESIAFQMRLAYECLMPLGISVKQIAITGGGAASRFTLQLRADILGIKTVSLRNKEAGTLGCMIAAAKAMGCYSSFEEGVDNVVHIKETFKSRPQYAEYYNTKYEKYKRLYYKMHDFK